MGGLLALTYHRILPERHKGALDVQTFRDQLAFLKSEGFKFTGLDGVRRILSGEGNADGRHVLLSFDDGWADNLAYAHPILKDAGAVATVAVNTALVNPAMCPFNILKSPECLRYEPDSGKALGDASYSRDFSSFLSWDEVGAMKESGVWEVACHGHTHFGCYRSMEKIRGFHPADTHWTMEYALGGELFDGAPRAEFASVMSAPRTALASDLVESLKKEPSDAERLALCRIHESPIVSVETDEGFRERLLSGLTSCLAEFNSQLGCSPSSLFWPWGHHSATSRQIASSLGFDMLFTMRKALVAPESDMSCIPRVAAPDSLKGLKRIVSILFAPALGSLHNILSPDKGRID